MNLDDEATMVKEETIYEQDQESTVKGMKDTKYFDYEPEQQVQYGQDQKGLNENNSSLENALDSTGSDNDPEQQLLDEVEQEIIDEENYPIKKSEAEKEKNLTHFCLDVSSVGRSLLGSIFLINTLKAARNSV